MHAVEHGGHGASARHLVYMLESTRPPSQADCLSPAHPAAPPPCRSADLLRGQPCRGVARVQRCLERRALMLRLAFDNWLMRLGK